MGAVSSFLFGSWSRLWWFIIVWLRDFVAIFIGRFINEGRRGYCDAFTSWHETIPVRSVFDHSYFSQIIDVTVFSHHFASGKFGLDFERTIGSFITISVRPIFIVLINLFQNGYRSWSRSRILHRRRSRIRRPDWSCSLRRRSRFVVVLVLVRIIWPLSQIRDS